MTTQTETPNVVQGFSPAVSGRPKGLHYAWTVAFIVATAHASFAQPPRPAESPRTVTLSVTEYNRLIDLAARAPQASTPAPVAAVLSSADLRIRVDRDTARGVFTVAGDVLRPGVAKVGLLSGATLV